MLDVRGKSWGERQQGGVEKKRDATVGLDRRGRRGSVEQRQSGEIAHIELEPADCRRLSPVDEGYEAVRRQAQLKGISPPVRARHEPETKFESADAR